MDGKRSNSRRPSESKNQTDPMEDMQFNDTVMDFLTIFTNQELVAEPYIKPYLIELLARWGRWRSRGRAPAVSFEAACVGGQAYLTKNDRVPNEFTGRIDSTLAKILAALVIDEVEPLARQQGGAVREKAVSIVADEFLAKVVSPGIVHSAKKRIRNRKTCSKVSRVSTEQPTPKNLAEGDVVTMELNSREEYQGLRANTGGSNRFIYHNFDQHYDGGSTHTVAQNYGDPVKYPKPNTKSNNETQKDVARSFQNPNAALNHPGHRIQKFDKDTTSNNHPPPMSYLANRKNSDVRMIQKERSSSNDQNNIINHSRYMMQRRRPSNDYQQNRRPSDEYYQGHKIVTDETQYEFRSRADSLSNPREISTSTKAHIDPQALKEHTLINNHVASDFFVGQRSTDNYASIQNSRNIPDNKSSRSGSRKQSENIILNISRRPSQESKKLIVSTQGAGEDQISRANHVQAQLTKSLENAGAEQSGGRDGLVSKRKGSDGLNNLLQSVLAECEDFIGNLGIKK